MKNGNAINVIMPVLNEEKTVGGVIQRVLHQGIVDRLIIVFDKRSTDNTLREIRKAIAKSGKCELVLTDRSRGKGDSVRIGLSRVKRGIVVIQDADEEYYPEDYPKLMAGVTSQNPVFGYRASNTGHQYLLGTTVSSLHTALFNLLFGQSVKDINAGYKIFTIGMLKGRKLRESGFELDIEVAATLAKNGYRIKNVPIRYKGRTYEEGKKIGASAAISMLLYILKSRLTP